MPFAMLAAALVGGAQLWYYVLLFGSLLEEGVGCLLYVFCRVCLSCSCFGEYDEDEEVCHLLSLLQLLLVVHSSGVYYYIGIWITFLFFY